MKWCLLLCCSMFLIVHFLLQAQIQIVSHSETKKNKVDEIGRIYDTWIGQIGKQHKEVPF